MYTNSIAIIRTECSTTARTYTVHTHNYEKEHPSQFVYDGYSCDKFTMSETVAGQLVIDLVSSMAAGTISVRHSIIFDNVKEVEILTSHT